MTNIQDRLGLEVDRVLNAPYLISLSNLQQVLQNCSAFDVQAWSEAAPDRVQPLAEAVIRYLALWPNASEILLALLGANEIKDALQLAHPSLLSNMIHKALSVPSLDPVASRIAITILSTDLPSQVCLPASAHTLLSRVIARAAQDPIAANIEAVYALIDGACRDVPKTLSEDQVDSLLHALKSIMRSVKHWKDQKISFYCLLIMRKLTKPNKIEVDVRVRDSFASLKLSSSTPQQIHDIERYFNGSEAGKLVELLVLHVIHCSSASPAEDPIKISTLCRKTLSYVNSKIRAEWSSKNQPHLQKLIAKLSTTQQQPLLQVEGFTFAALIMDLNEISQPSIESLQQAVASLTTGIGQDAMEPELISKVYEQYSKQFTKSFWLELLSSITDRVLDKQSSLSRSQRKNLEQWIESMLPAARNCEPLRQAVIEKLASPTFTFPITELCQKSYLSYAGALFSAHIQLDSRFATTLLSIAFLSMHMDRICPEVAICHELLKWQHSLLCLSNESRRLELNSKLLNISPETIDYAEKPDCSRNWRSTFLDLFADEDPHRNTRTINLIGQLCRDFESRCDKAEKPLKEEQRKCSMLGEELKDAMNEMCNLDEQLKSQQKELIDARKAVEETGSDLNAASNEIQDLRDVAARLEKNLKKAAEEHQENIDEMKCQHNDIEIELRAKIAAEAETQDLQSEKIVNLEQKLLEDQVKLQNLEGRLISAEAEAQKAYRLWHAEQAAMCDKDDLIASLKEKLESTNTEILEVKERESHQLIESERQTENYKAELGGMIHERESLQSQLEQSVKNFERQLQEARLAAEDQAAAYSLELESRDRTLKSRQQKLDGMAGELAEKEAELANAKELKHRLLKAMGMRSDDKTQDSIPSNTLKDQRSLLQSPGLNDNEDTRSDTLPCSRAPRPMKSLEASFDSSTSSETSGPTPKRVKPRPKSSGFATTSYDKFEARRGVALEESERGNIQRARHEEKHSNKAILNTTAKSGMSGQYLFQGTSWNEKENLGRGAGEDNLEHLGSFDFDISTTEL